MRIVPIPCLSDNYAYLVICNETRAAAVVDPSEAEPIVSLVEKILSEKRGGGIKVTQIWATHHHHDHVGGIEEVAKAFNVTDVFGYESDKGRIPAQTRFLTDGETFSLGKLSVQASHIPGHTLGAVAYAVSRPGQDTALFTGDTLFLSGCGRIFEGTPEMMHASLQKLAQFSDETRIYCGHEYTLSNLRFAAHLEPTNANIQRAKELAAAARQEGRPTVPRAIREERLTNPFFRTDSAELRATLGMAEYDDDLAVFTVARRAKDVFK